MKEPDIEMNLKKIMERIKWIRETKAILSKEEISLSIPLMQDLSQVGNIYDKFELSCRTKFHNGTQAIYLCYSLSLFS